MSRMRARIALLTLALLLTWGVLPASKPAPADPPPPPGKGDSALFMKVIERLASGEEYYEAFGDELRADDYPTRSPFNWRAPFHLTMVASATVPAARLVLKLLTLAAVLVTAAVLARFGRTAAIVGTLAQMGALATAFRPQAVGVAEVCAGVLIALSACAYYRSWWVPGALLGIAAVFTRELAAPYCVVCAILAIIARRRESAAWIAGGLAYAAYYGIHVWQVSAHQLPGDLAQLEPWQQWNGLRFILASIGVNGWLAFVPGWAAAIYMTLGLTGAASRTIAAQVKWALLAYFGLFAVVGLPFNYYWGFVTAPLWAFGLAHAVDGIETMARAAGASRSHSDRRGRELRHPETAGSSFRHDSQ